MPSAKGQDMDWATSSISSTSTVGPSLGSSLPPGTATLPIFVFPSSISFNADDSSTHKQVLTLYNPYDFKVKFRVFSTDAKKYSVVEPEGVINNKHYVDIVVRINDISPRHHNLSDQLRIVMQQQQLVHDLKPKARTTPSVWGFKDVPTTLYPTQPEIKDASSSNRRFEQMQCSSNSGPDSLTQSQLFPDDNRSESIRGEGGRQGPTRGPQTQLPNYFLIFLSVAAAVVLMLPNCEEDKPSYLAFLPIPTVNIKLCAAYILGCVTKPLLWP